MKKFIILSVLVALAGISIGVLRRQSDSPAAVAAATEVSTSTTVVPGASSTTVTTARKATTKTTVKAATPTTARPATSPTTAVPAQVASTTSTTTARSQPTTPTCSVAATSVVLTGYDGVAWEDIRITSNMTQTRTRLQVEYPGAKVQQFWLTTSANGAAEKRFQVRQPGSAQAIIDFYDVAENHIGGSPACQTAFEIAEY